MESKNGRAANNQVNFLPVAAADQYGEGLPYAPENFPSEGDIWGWKTGRRVTPTGNFQDRYLYLPDRLNQAENQGSGRKQKHIFASKLSVERYIKANFPHTDLDAFFASFSWRIPATSGNAVPIAAMPLKQVPVTELSESDMDTVKCKAGNKMCDSLMFDQVEKYGSFMPCDICCAETGFCRDCCCILCSNKVCSAYSGYSFIKCLAKTDEGICGHVAHMECALRAYMAGTVGGSIALDAEYFCRRCTETTDLITHVKKLLQTCKADNLDAEIQRKILNLGTCLLRRSQKAVAKELLAQIELAITKLNCGTNLEDDIFKVDDKLSAQAADHGNDVMEFTVKDDVMEVTVNSSLSDVRTEEESYDDLSRSLKLEGEVDEVLYALRKSQEFEYKVAEEVLQSHKTYLQNLYQQLECEKLELKGQNSSRSNVLHRAVREREEQIRREEAKFEVMKKVAHGFGQTSKDILKKHFGVEIAD